MKQVDDCDLGKHLEDLRLYLLGKSAFPSEASILMFVLEPSSVVARPERLISFPSSRETPIGWLYGFVICGLAFRCFMGPSLDELTSAMSLASIDPVKYVFLSKAEDFPDFHEIHRAASAATMRGMLARNAVKSGADQ